MSQFQLDIYGQITNTSFKIIVMKNEMCTNREGGKPSTYAIKTLFDNVHTYHTNMIMNPFFESANHKSMDSKLLGDDVLSEESSNSDCSSCGSRGSMDSRGSIEKKERPKVKYWSTKQMNKECLKQLKQRIDKRVFEFDKSNRDNY